MWFTILNCGADLIGKTEAEGTSAALNAATASTFFKCCDMVFTIVIFTVAVERNTPSQTRLLLSAAQQLKA